MKNDSDKPIHQTASILLVVVALIGLYFTSRVNYLFFHALAEGFSIVVAFSIFMIAWNSKKFIHNPYLLFIGVAYLFIAFLDAMHTLSYKGMPIFTDYDYYANQLWICARYLESITLLIAFIFLRKDKVLKVDILFAIYTVITCVIIASIFCWKIFPECFVEGIGLTPFKKISEYVICVILIADIFILCKNREKFDEKVYIMLFWSIIFTIISELSFTFYISNYGFSNLVGHYFKIFSFLLIYVAIIQTGIEKPFELIFLDLDKTNKRLKREIEARAKTQRENEDLINELKKALEEIKTLTGVIPICAYCKKIRDEKGAWDRMEAYISAHSEAQFSHGICPECYKKEMDGLDQYKK